MDYLVHVTSQNDFENIPKDGTSHLHWLSSEKNPYLPIKWYSRDKEYEKARTYARKDPDVRLLTSSTAKLSRRCADAAEHAERPKADTYSVIPSPPISPPAPLTLRKAPGGSGHSAGRSCPQLRSDAAGERGTRLQGLRRQSSPAGGPWRTGAQTLRALSKPCLLLTHRMNRGVHTLQTSGFSVKP